MATPLEWTTLSARGVGAASGLFSLFLLLRFLDAQVLLIWDEQKQWILRKIAFFCFKGNG